MKSLLIVSFGIFLTTISSAFAANSSYVSVELKVKKDCREFRNLSPMMDEIQAELLKEEENQRVVTDKFGISSKAGEIKRFLVTESITKDAEDISQSQVWALIIDQGTCNTYYKLL